MEEKNEKNWDNTFGSAMDSIFSMSFKEASIRYQIPNSVSVTDLALAKSVEHINNLISEEANDPPEESTNEPRTSNASPSTSLNPDDIEVIHKLSPLPDEAKTLSAARKRKGERSEILTTSPYKVAVEEKEKEKNAKEEKKITKTKLKLPKEENGQQTKDVKAKGRSEEKGKQAKGKSGDKAKKKQPETEMKKMEKEDGKTTCVVCLEDYEEDWIQCASCHGWAHQACADIPECSDVYICDRCLIY